MKSQLPFYVVGKVVKGFGRGSKSLGIPTANYEQSVVDLLPAELTTGIYFGWAQIGQSPVYKCCLSLGWNPYFGNQVKSMETHILHKFEDDFYGSVLKVCIAGYIRDEMNFSNIDELKTAIHNDIQVTSNELDKPEIIEYSKNQFFQTDSSSGQNGHINGATDDKPGRSNGHV